MAAPNPGLVRGEVQSNAAGLGAAMLPFKEHFFL
jgi:hypothetical protein